MITRSVPFKTNFVPSRPPPPTLLTAEELSEPLTPTPLVDDDVVVDDDDALPCEIDDLLTCVAAAGVARDGGSSADANPICNSWCEAFLGSIGLWSLVNVDGNALTPAAAADDEDDADEEAVVVEEG